MAKIQLPDGTMKDDQRVNGARLKLHVGDWIKIILVILGFVWGYAILTATVNHNSAVLAEQSQDVKENSIRSRKNETDIANLKSDVGEIKKDVKQILTLIK